MAQPTILQDVEKGALNAIISAVQANAAVLEATLTAGEADLTAGLTNLIKNIPSVKGVAGIFADPIETAVENAITAYVASLLAKYTPAQLVAVVVAFLQAEVAKV